MLNQASEGYEYQDLFSLFLVLIEILNRKNTSFYIDQKITPNDIFDDFKIVKDKCIECVQIKYSNGNTAHALEKADLANGNGHDTAIDQLFIGWKQLTDKYSDNNHFYLCTSWSIPDENDMLCKILKPVNSDNDVLIRAIRSYMPQTEFYQINADVLWPSGSTPLKGWNRLKKAAEDIGRREFERFCNNFIICVQLSKASMDIHNPGTLEKILMEMASNMGAGIYPNQNKTAENVVLNMLEFIRKCRLQNEMEPVSINKFIQSSRMITDYQMINHCFPVDMQHCIVNEKDHEELLHYLRENGNVVLTGNPGCGKSWFTEMFCKHLQTKGQKFIRFNCYKQLDDQDGLKRIQKNVLLLNLVGQLLEIFELYEFKHKLYGADRAEVCNLLEHVEEECFLIVDGLDHIERQYKINQESLSRKETEILEELLVLPKQKNIHILLVSQPIAELNPFYGQGYLEYHMPKWDKYKIARLMDLYDMEADAEPLTGMLLEKSQGNALYLNYLLRELYNYEDKLEKLQSLPEYDIHLEKYYNYLCLQVQGEKLLYTLAGAEFYLNEQELTEITGYGNQVYRELTTLKPILRQNEVAGGYLIYHESFRRYLIEQIYKQGMDPVKVIYRDCMEWLLSKNHFEEVKSYCHLLSLLLRTSRMDEVRNIADSNYVYNSVYHGYSYKMIHENLQYILRCYCRLEDIAGCTLALELLNVLEVTHYEIGGNTSYYKALSAIKGAKQLSQMLCHNDKPAFSENEGLEICYICSRNGVIPRWEFYADENLEEVELDKISSYFRYWVDSEGNQAVNEIVLAWEEEWQQAFAECIYDDIVDYLGKESFRLFCEQNKLTHWSALISQKDNFSLYEVNITETEIEKCIGRISAMNYPGDKEKQDIKLLFCSVYTYGRKKSADKICKLLEEKIANRNWFFNWMIFAVNMIRIYSSDIADIREAEILEWLQYLLKDTDVFKGSPRTCDLFSMETMLYDTYRMALSLLAKGEREENIALVEAFEILGRLSEETTTLLDNAPGGPLVQEKRLLLMTEYIAFAPADSLKEEIENVIQKSVHRNYYASLARLEFELTTIFYKVNEELAKEHYERGIHLLLAYTLHKEISWETIMDGYEVLWNNNSGKAKEVRENITRHTFALLSHTDGRVTKRFPNHWFRTLLETNQNYALSFLIQFQQEAGSGYILEDMILDVISKLSSQSMYDEELICLIKTLPNNYSEKIINASLKIIERTQISKPSKAKELIVNLLSRLPIKEQLIKGEMYYLEEPLVKLCDYAENLSLEIGCFRSWIASQQEKKETYFSSEKDCIQYDVELDEMVKQLRRKYLCREDIPKMKEYLDGCSQKDIIWDTMIESLACRENSCHYRDYVVELIEVYTLTTQEKVSLYIKLFMNSYSYGMQMAEPKYWEIACSLDEDFACHTFFELMEEAHGLLGVGILKAMQFNKKLKEDTNKVWDILYEINVARIPILVDDSATWNGLSVIDEELETELLLQHIISGRMLSEEKERVMSVLEYLMNLFIAENDNKLKKALQYFLKNFCCFDYYCQYLILWFLEMYFSSFSSVEEITEHIDIQLLKTIYPMNDYLLDFQLEGILSMVGMENELIKVDNQKQFLRRLEKNLHPDNIMEPLLLWENHTCRKKETLDPWYITLENFGFDASELFGYLYYSEDVKEHMSDFTNNMLKIPVENTFLKSCIMQQCVIAVLHRALKNERMDLCMLIPKLQIPVREMDAFRRSRILLPKDCRYVTAKKEQIASLKMDGEFCEIARTEYMFLKKDYKDIDMQCYFEALVPKNCMSSICSSWMESFINMDTWIYADEEEPFYLELSYPDTHFQKERYIWLNPVVAFQLGITMAIDYAEEGIIGMDVRDEIVLKMKNWRCAYYGNDDYKGQEFPMSRGCILYMREDYVRKMKGIFGEMVWKEEKQ